MDQDFLGQRLIFLISQPRSGSTLLQRLLAGHPTMLTSAEPWLMLHPLYALREAGIQAEYDAREAYQALQDFLSHYAGGEETYLRGVRELARVLYTQSLAQMGKEIFLDKTPRYYYIIPELYWLFPQARFIFLIRNPLAVLNSVIHTWIRQQWAEIYRFRDDLLLAPNHILAGIDLLGENAIRVCYEDLVSSPEETMSALCQRLGIAYNSEMLHYGAREAPLGRRGDHVGIKKHSAPAKDSLEQWKSLVENEQTRHFAQAYLAGLGQETIHRLGYSFDELNQVVQQPAVVRQRAVVPWEIAIRPQETWTRHEYLVIIRALAIQNEGYNRGLVTYFRQNFTRIIRDWVTR
jgi:hypothetical protein